ncbi:class I adenylate-forming enzyme family protein [Streptomyces coffeae]|uniref:Acyl--CoA ligase n=1 Tax=Streptomyces coffeae TaxID=621382 RepID=A0ABS1NM83_9ACTN|nr:class I adenylate-forming enzyme family protein [Streptomyces coffeae]MBL1101002.1 acyl--CoA ligase [Streptomyces coffeae]
MTSSQRLPPAISVRRDYGRDDWTIAHSFCEAVTAAPGRIALRCGDRSLTYLEYGRCVAGLTAHLSRLEVADKRVAIVLPNGPEIAVAILAAFFARAQVALLNSRYPEAELKPLLDDADPAVLITGSDTTSASTAARRLGIPVLTLGSGDLNLTAWSAQPELHVDKLPRPRPSDSATLMYTGGTTGRPKGIVHTHRTLLLTVEAMEYCWPTDRTTPEVWAAIAPMTHIWGLLMGVLNPLYGQATVVAFTGPFQPDQVVAALERHRVTVLGGGPAAIYSALLAVEGIASADLSSLRVCPGGGSAFPQELHRAWAKTVGVQIREAYGMTELAPITCPAGSAREGSVGQPAPLIEMRICDTSSHQPLPADEVGEVHVRAPHMLVAYHNGAPATARADGWLATGDLGRMDDEGYLYIVGRSKDMIIVGGFNVYPRELDEVLAAHPHVEYAVTVGVPDQRKGERPVSFVVPAPGRALDVRELHALCADKLASYKLPIEIMVVDSIPLTAANKPDYQALRARWAAASRAAAQPGSRDTGK